MDWIRNLAAQRLLRANKVRFSDVAAFRGIVDVNAASSGMFQARRVASVLFSRNALTSRIDGCPKRRLRSRLDWLTLSYLLRKRPPLHRFQLPAYAVGLLVI